LFVLPQLKENDITNQARAAFVHSWDDLLKSNDQTLQCGYTQRNFNLSRQRRHIKKEKEQQAGLITYCCTKLLGLLLTWWRQPPLPLPTSPCCSPVKGDGRKIKKTNQKNNTWNLKSHNISCRCCLSFGSLLIYPNELHRLSAAFTRFLYL